MNSCVVEKAVMNVTKMFLIGPFYLCNAIYVNKPARSKEWELTLDCHCYIRFSQIQMFWTTS